MYLHCCLDAARALMLATYVPTAVRLSDSRHYVWRVVTAADRKSWTVPLCPNSSFPDAAAVGRRGQLFSEHAGRISPDAAGVIRSRGIRVGVVFDNENAACRC